ncbi:hypothetical protein JF512_15930, partial [Listeria monocytogenes]|nr:hypothetical protein [Listeria monocytogenes]
MIQINPKSTIASVVLKQYIYLTVFRSENGNAVWECVCVCGNEKEVLAQHLKRGHVQSCGCLAKENG